MKDHDMNRVPLWWIRWSLVRHGSLNSIEEEFRECGHENKNCLTSALLCAWESNIWNVRWLPQEFLAKCCPCHADESALCVSNQKPNHSLVCMKNIYKLSKEVIRRGGVKSKGRLRPGIPVCCYPSALAVASPCVCASDSDFLSLL